MARGDAHYMKMNRQATQGANHEYDALMRQFDAEDRAVRDAKTIVLPPWTLFGKHAKIPHAARTILKRKWFNEHERAVEYVVKQARNGKTWWINALYPEEGHYPMRASNTLRTMSKKVADGWLEAVESGNVRVGD